MRIDLRYICLVGLCLLFQVSKGQCPVPQAKISLLEANFDTGDYSDWDPGSSKWRINEDAIGPYQNPNQSSWLHLGDMSDDALENQTLDLPPIVLTGDSGIDISFDLSHRPYGDKGVLKLYVDRGGDWKVIYEEEKEFVGTVDIRLAALDEAVLQLRFEYDDEGSWTWGAGIDNIRISQTGAGCGDGVCAPGEDPENCPLDCEVETPNPYWIPVGQNIKGESVSYRYFKGRTACDDCSEEIELGFSFNFFGESYESLFINSNGNLTFIEDFIEYTPEPFCLNGPKMIAPFFGDADLNKGGEIRYYLDPEGHYLIVSWLELGYFGCEVDCDLRNTFQCILHDGSVKEILGQQVSSMANVLFMYQDMEWTTGNSSGGEEGFKGSSATVGLNSGSVTNCHDYGTFDHPGYDYLGNYQDDACDPAGVSHLDYRMIMGNGSEGEMLDDRNLYEFTAEKQEDTHVLKWSVWANEFFDRFTLERCTKGASFLPIYEETGDANAGPATYEYEIAAPEEEVSYRVIFSRRDGEMLVSDTISFNGLAVGGDQLNLRAWPNPFSDQLNLSLEIPLNQEVHAVLVNENAQIVWKESYPKGSGNLEKVLSLGQLASGTYYLSVKSETEQKHLNLIKR